MKSVLFALAILVGSSAFAAPARGGHKHHTPLCKELVNNTIDIITLKPLRTARTPIEAGSKVVFAVIREGVSAGTCTARVTVRAGHLVVKGVEGAMHTGMVVVEGAADLVADILGSIFEN